MLFSIETVYSFPSIHAPEKFYKEHDCSKIENFSFPEYHAWLNLYESQQVMISCRPMKNRRYLPSTEPLQQKMNKIIESAPCYIDGLQALWYYFNFRNVHPEITQNAHLEPPRDGRRWE